MAAAEHTPPKSHVVVETSPIEADASAPRCPTIAASIYCMTMDESWAITAGTLSNTVSRIRWANVIGLPSRIRASKASVRFACRSVCSTQSSFSFIRPYGFRKTAAKLQEIQQTPTIHFPVIGRDESFRIRSMLQILTFISTEFYQIFRCYR